jgi:hypothetical protein
MRQQYPPSARSFKRVSWCTRISRRGSTPGNTITICFIFGLSSEYNSNLSNCNLYEPTAECSTLLFLIVSVYSWEIRENSRLAWVSAHRDSCRTSHRVYPVYPSGQCKPIGFLGTRITQSKWMLQLSCFYNPLVFCGQHADWSPDSRIWLLSPHSSSVLYVSLNAVSLLSHDFNKPSRNAWKYWGFYYINFYTFTA